MDKEITIELIHQCVSKERLAQRQLYDILLPYLNVICKRYLNQESNREDVLQEAFIRIFKSIKSYDAGKSSLKTWAAKITINCCFNDNKKNKNQYIQAYEDAIHDVAMTPDILEKLNTEELHQWLRKLPKPYYQVFNLSVIEGFSHEEIANILGIKASLSRKRLSRAKKWIQNTKVNNRIVWQMLTGS